MPNKHVQAAAEGLPKIPDFPLYGAMQGPADDLAHARSLIRIVSGILEDGSSAGINSGMAQDLYALVGDIIIYIDPVQLFLEEIDNSQPLYQECRRRVILEASARAGS